MMKPLHGADSQPLAPRTRPPFTLSRLQEVHTTLERLRGADCDLLKVIGFDQQLDELAALCADLDRLNDINSQMSTTDSAFELLLTLLDAAGDKPLPIHGLHALMQPLCQRHTATWNTLSDML